MKKIVFICLITILVCCTQKKKGSKNNYSITKNESVSTPTEIDSLNYTGINSFEEFYNKIPNIKLYILCRFTRFTREKSSEQFVSSELSGKSSSIEYWSGHELSPIM